jgi:restriction endonuclease S subunit
LSPFPCTIAQAVKGINTAEVRPIPIPLPSDEDRHGIVQLLHQTEQRLRTESDRLAQLTKMNMALSQTLLTGADG